MNEQNPQDWCPTDMNEQTTHDRIKKIICTDIASGTSASDLNNDTSLFDDLQLDSIQLIELVTQIESEFSIDMDDEDMDFQHFATVHTLAEFVNGIVAR